MRPVATGPAVEFALSIVDGRVDVFGAFDGEADVSVTGSLGALRSLSRSNDALYTGAVRIEGDIGVARGLSELVARLDIDLEEILAPVLGGTLARRIGLAGRDARTWLGRTATSFRANIEEYLKEESELLPTADEVERWAAEVDELRGSADRLEARLRLFERRRTASAGRGDDRHPDAAGAAGSAGADDR